MSRSNADQAVIAFGALASPITVQLWRQKLESRKELNWEEVQKDADAITRLYVCGLLTSGEVDKVRSRFVSRLQLQPKDKAK